MNAATHQSVIHFLAAHRPTTAAQQIQVEALLAQHERNCADEAEREAADQPTCPPCRFDWQCRQGRCPARDPKSWPTKNR